MYGRQSKKPQVFVLAVCALLVVFYVLTQRSARIAQPLSSLQAEVYAFVQRLRQSFVSFSEAQQLRTENADLRSQVAQLQTEKVTLADAKAENEKLKEALKFRDDRTLPTVVARVVSRNVLRPNTLLINAGSAEGIALSMPVVSAEGIFIGTVVGVKETSATVLLLTDPSLKVAVTSGQEKNSIGIAQGEFGLSISITLIPQNVAIAPGDVVTTSGLEDGMPRSLVIGTVTRVDAPQNELFKTATVTSTVPYDQITTVSVIKNR